MRVLIVGGVAGGATAAARLRRLDEAAEITMLERGGDVSFANCGLPYYIGEEIKDRAKLLLHTPASLGSALKVDVRTGHEVLSVDRAAKTVKVRVRGAPSDGAAGGAGAAPAAGDASEVVLPYDKLLLSTGAAPMRPPIPGAAPGALPHVFVLRDVRDADAIKARVDELAARGAGGRAVVLGGGFIGLEVVEQLVRRGLAVTIVEMQRHVLPQMDDEMTVPLTNDLRASGVTVLTESRATEITAAAAGSGSLVVRLASGEAIPADMVLLATGVRPESGLAAAAGLEVDPATRTIIVDEHLRTTDPSIYAVGDAISAPSLVVPTQRTWLPMGGPANRQARLAAEHMVLGEKADKYRGNLGTGIVRAFNTTAGMTGMGEAALKKAGVPYEVALVHGQSHAGYYPGAEPIALKVMYHAETRQLLGAQAVGGSEGVDKRLDVLATAISSKASVDDLAHLELTYAPPFGSARDIVNTAGFAAQNAAAGLLVPQRSLASLPPDRVVVDVRDATTAAMRPVAPLLPPGQKVVLLPDVRGGVASLDKTASYTTVCNLGKMSYFAARTLAQAGLDVSSLQGGVTMALPPIPNPAPAAEGAGAPLGTSPAAAAAATGHGATTAAASAGAATGSVIVEVDACGLACPGPIMALRRSLPLAPGSTLVAKASDPGFMSDVKAFAASAGLAVLSVTREKGVITARLANAHTPGSAASAAAAAAAAPSAAAHASATSGGAGAVPAGSAAPSIVAAAVGAPNPHDTSIIVFSGELDKVLAALVLANGAVAMGGRATLFFTFWGLSALKSDHTFPDLEKAPRSGGHDAGGGVGEHPSVLQRMMAKMLPSGPASLPLSHMNFGGAGPKMMQSIMADKHLPTVPSLMRSAVESGRVRFVACTMSMEALGIPSAALLPFVELGGVADFMGAAATSKNTLFI